jgi:hypothetical protein
MYSLWRGRVMLGRITPELPHDVPSAIIGILQPSDAFSPDHALMQRTMADLPGSPAWQHPIPRPQEEKGLTRGVEFIGPRILSEEDLRGVPEERLLQLRNASGQTIPTDDITVMEMRLANHEGIEALCSAAGVTFSGWYVTAGLTVSSRAL